MSALNPGTKALLVRTEIDTMASTTQKLIIALVTIALLLTVLTVTLWQRGVIFSSSHLTNSGSNESAKNFPKNIPKGVATAATMHASTNNVTTEITEHAFSDTTTAATAHASTYVTTDATNDAAQDASSELTSTVNQVDTDRTIYFGTMGSGIKALSTKTSQVTTIAMADSIESFYAVAYDKKREKLYWTSNYKMYQSRADGTDAKTLVVTTRRKLVPQLPVLHCCQSYNCKLDLEFTDGWFWGLGIDWIAGRAYLATGNGSVIACNVLRAQDNKCANVLRVQGSLYGIALDPEKGYLQLVSFITSSRCK